MYYSDKNISFRRIYFIDRSFPTEEQIRLSFAGITGGKDKIKTVDYFSETDETKAAYHYLLRSHALKVICKGLRAIDAFEKRRNIELPDFDRYLAASNSKTIIPSSNRTGVPVQQLVGDLYRWQAEAKIEQKRSPQKCLIVEQETETLPDEMMAKILQDAAEKKQYRHQQLSLLVELLAQFENSLALHQAIGRHLGIDEFQLRRIHETVSGIMVRSKSEVIIANLLAENGVNFEYELPLRAEGQTYAPDFTIVAADGKVFYWEHLGMLDLDDYRASWAIKQAWYQRNFLGQLITTEESPLLSRIAKSIIREKFNKDVSGIHNDE